jgi:hypothetical protein
LDFFAAGYLAGIIFAFFLVLAVAILSAYQWEYGLAASIASLSLVNRLKTEYNIDLGYVLVTIETVLICLLLFASFIRVGQHSREESTPYLRIPVAILLISGALSLFDSLDIEVSIRLFITGVIEPIIVFYLIVTNINSARQVKLILLAIIVSGTFAAAYGAWQIFTIAGLGEGNPFDYRVVSVFYSPAILGEIMLLTFPIALVVRIALQQERSSAVILLDVALGLIFVAIAMTITRSTWLGFLVALVVLIFGAELSIRRYITRRIPLIIFVVILLAIKSGAVSDVTGLLELFERRPVSMSDFSDDTTSIGERIFAWGVALEMMVDHPLGIGLGMFKHVWPLYKPTHAQLDAAHQIFLDTGVELGFLGLVGFLWVVFKSLVLSRRLAKSAANPEFRLMGLGIFSAFVGYMVHAVSGGAELVHNITNVDSPLGSPIATGMLLFWSLVGCLHVLARIESRLTRNPSSVLRSLPP